MVRRRRNRNLEKKYLTVEETTQAEHSDLSVSLISRGTLPAEITEQTPSVDGAPQVDNIENENDNYILNRFLASLRNKSANDSWENESEDLEYPVEDD